MLDRLVKELFKKYQIEIVKPNINYFVEKYQTAHEKYNKNFLKIQKTKNDYIETNKAFKPLIEFKHTTYDKKKK